MSRQRWDDSHSLKPANEWPRLEPKWLRSVVVVVTTFRKSVCPQLLRINYAQPGAQHLGVNSRRQRQPPALKHSPVSARGLQKIDLRKTSNVEHAEKYREHIENNVQISKCNSRATEASIVHCSADCRQSWEHSARCVKPAKPVWNMPLPLSTMCRPEEQDVNRAQKPKQPLHVENRKNLPKATVDNNMYP